MTLNGDLGPWGQRSKVKSMPSRETEFFAGIDTASFSKCVYIVTVASYALYIVQCTIYNCTMYIVHRTIVQCAIFHWSLYNVHCTTYSRVYDVHSTVTLTLYIIHRTSYVLCTSYIVHRAS